MLFKAIEKGVEVNGQTVIAIVNGFSTFKHVPSKVLVEEGIGTLLPDGRADIKPDAWYPLDAWLRAFDRIFKDGSETILFNIGAKIPESAVFPPHIKTIETAIQSIDVAYHMNHRKDGKVMFDPKTGVMLEGIGHYGYDRARDRNLITCVCKKPGSCGLDRGIITAMAKRFEPRATVEHDSMSPCRKKGAASCTYLVRWPAA